MTYSFPQYSALWEIDINMRDARRIMNRVVMPMGDVNDGFSTIEHIRYVVNMSFSWYRESVLTDLLLDSAEVEARLNSIEFLEAAANRQFDNMAMAFQAINANDMDGAKYFMDENIDISGEFAEHLNFIRDNVWERMAEASQLLSGFEQYRILREIEADFMDVRNFMIMLVNSSGSAENIDDLEYLINYHMFKVAENFEKFNQLDSGDNAQVIQLITRLEDAILRYGQHIPLMIEAARADSRAEAAQLMMETAAILSEAYEHLRSLLNVIMERTWSNYDNIYFTLNT